MRGGAWHAPGRRPRDRPRRLVAGLRAVRPGRAELAPLGRLDHFGTVAVGGRAAAVAPVTTRAMAVGLVAAAAVPARGRDAVPALGVDVDGPGHPAVAVDGQEGLHVTVDRRRLQAGRPPQDAGAVRSLS